jgi:1-acyl-sn-glycerol-3-phosphate acyltransferase
MSVVDVSWAVGRLTIQPVVSVATRLRVYGAERMPPEGGCVLACNHFSWIDPPVLGAASPRVVYFMAKMEAHTVPGLGSLIRSFGAFPVRRGESDREAVRTMRRIVADGHALGLFAEGTRQHSGEPGHVQPGAAMVAIQEGVPIVPAAIHGSQSWRAGNFHPVSLAWGTPMRFDGLPRGGKGYKEASLLLQEEIRRLWEWLVLVHERGRPSGTPPAGIAPPGHEPTP